MVDDSDSDRARDRERDRAGDGEELSAADIEHVAHLYSAPTEARFLLESIGISRSRHPSWNVGSPLAFWREIASLLGTGIIDDGRRKLLDTVERDQAGGAPVSRPAGSPQVTVPRPTNCVQRAEVVDELVGRLLEPGGPVVVRGLPGVGKTTVIAEAACDRRLLDRFGAVLWVRLGPGGGHADALRQLWVQLIGPLPAGSLPGDADERLRLALASLATLLVVDDLWDAQVGARLSALRPERLLATTRNRDVARALADRPDDIVNLPHLDTDRAQGMFGHFAPQVSSAYPEQVHALVDALEGLPLAIRVAAALLHTEQERNLGREQELFAQLRITGRLLRAQAPGDRFDPRTGTTPTIDELFRQSTSRLAEPDQVRFALLGWAAPKPAVLAADLLAELWETDEKQTFDSIGALFDHGLLEPRAQLRTFHLHATLRLHARSLLR